MGNAWFSMFLQRYSPLTSVRRLVAGLAVLGALWCSPAGAQTVGLAAELPLGGYCRAGDWVPVGCTLTNQGPPVDVQIRSQVRDYGPNPSQRVYELNVALPSPANRRYWFYVMPLGPYVNTQFELQLLQGRQVIGKQQVTARPLNDGDRLVAVIAAEEGGYGGLSGSRVSRGGGPVGGYRGPGGPGVPPGYAGPGGGQGQVQVTYVKPELAPDRAIGYQAADLVILGAFAQGSLSPVQESALTRWVQAGGRLIITGGADTSALQTPALRALLPVEITGTVTLAGREASGALRQILGYSSQRGAAMPGAASRRSPDAALVATACRPRPGARTLWARPGTPILVSWPVGAGEVFFLAADPTRPPLRDWEGLGTLWRAILLAPTTSTHYLSLLEGLDQWGGFPPGYPGSYPGYSRLPSLASACLQVSQMDVPAFGFIGLFLLAYIAVLVPGNYAFLKRRDRRELAWVTTPAIVFLFSGLAYVIGYGTKGGQIVMAQAGVVEAWAGRGAAPAMTYLGLFSPRKTRYDVAAAEGAVPLRPVDLDEGGRRALRVVEGDAFGLKEVPVDMWDMALFQGNSVVDLQGGFESALKRVDGRLVGRVTNRTPFDLVDAVLLSGNGVRSWGTLKSGETRSVDTPWSPINAGAPLPSAVLNSIHGRGAPARMRRALAEPLTNWGAFSSRGAGGGWRSPAHPVLLGWVTRPLLPVRVDGRPVHDQAAHMFLVHLPVK
jgi:hypothetical protein